ncbi:MAG: hypothetical protein KA140_01685 [Caldisericia bacterium]|nr:hypothetical protein [Caldisericia bacterium]
MINPKSATHKPTIMAVPDIVAGASGEGGTGNTLVDVLLAGIIRDGQQKKSDQ